MQGSQDKKRSEFSWHAEPLSRIYEMLATASIGLSRKEADARFARLGQNTLPRPPHATGARIFLRQLKSAFTLILSIAAGVSWSLGDYFDALFICIAVVVNIAFGFAQEWRAEKALQELENMVPMKAHALRDAAVQRINASEVVVGDVLFLAAGEQVPADIRVLSEESLEVNQSTLTGESYPAKKSPGVLAVGTMLGDRTNMLFAGTALVRGEGSGVVVATGTHTEFGRIAESLTEIPQEETPLEHRLRGLAQWITYTVLGLAGAILMIGVLLGMPFVEIFTTASAVAVAAIPEGLIVAVTVILVIGMRRLVAKQVIVRRLRAAETLGSVTVICVDKTGTITEGDMRVVEVLTPTKSFQERQHALRAAVFANEAWLEEAPHRDGRSSGAIVGEPTDAAILTAALAAGMHEQIDARKKLVHDLLPFSSETQFSAALVDGTSTQHKVMAVKGAAEKLLAVSMSVRIGDSDRALTPHERGAFMRQHNSFSERGMRVIAVAEKRVPVSVETLRDLSFQGLTFLGFIVFEDPIRASVRSAIAGARQAGVKTILITGDHMLTARAVAETIGIPASRVVNGEELSLMSDEKLKEALAFDAVFARMVPHQKLRIVQLLKQNGEVVAMTGDGINDAPALRASDIGVALGSGTEVAKASGELVLLDGNFATLAGAIYEGRIIFENIRKVAVFLLIDTFSEIVMVSGSLLLGLPLALVATQILFVNLVEDSAPTFSLAFERGEPESMRRPPRPAREPILDREALLLIFAVGLPSDIFLLGIYAWMLHIGIDAAYARTVVFAAIGLDSFTQVFALRSLTRPFWRMNPFDNPVLVAAVVFGVGAIVAAVHVPFLQEILRTVPLTLPGWLLVASLSLFAVIPVEIIKYFSRRTLLPRTE